MSSVSIADFLRTAKRREESGGVCVCVCVWGGDRRCLHQPHRELEVVVFGRGENIEENNTYEVEANAGHKNRATAMSSSDEKTMHNELWRREKTRKVEKEFSRHKSTFLVTSKDIRLKHLRIIIIISVLVPFPLRERERGREGGREI